MVSSASTKTRLSVNVNKFALLRNSRGGDLPSVLSIARRCLEGGAAGITVHPRQDQRHIRYQDVRDLRALLTDYPEAELNVEGTPNEELLRVVLEVRPHQCTLVPDAPGQLTSDHGWRIGTEQEVLLRPVIAKLQEAGVRVSLFVDDDAQQLANAKRVGADCVELYTGPYAKAFAEGNYEPVLESFRSVGQGALDSGLTLNAGHDLNQQNLGIFLRRVTGVAEVSIGHAFICDCIDTGFDRTLAGYLKICDSTRPASAVLSR